MGNKNEYFPLIILAGGRSSRMGTPKGLLDYHGHPWLIEQLRRFKAVPGKRVIIVLGYHQAPYFEQIPWLEKAVKQPEEQLGLEISTIVNPIPEYGQFSSLQAAIGFLHAHYSSPSPQPSPSRLSLFDSLKAQSWSKGSSQATRGEGVGFPSSTLRDLPAGRDRGGGGAFILPIDVPCPEKEVFKKLTEAFSPSIDAAIPQYQSTGGHPVLLGGDFLSRLAEVPLSSPLARLDLQIQSRPEDRIALVSVNDKSISLNMNFLDEFRDYAQTEKESFKT